MQQPDDLRCGPSFQPWRTLPQQEATHTQRSQRRTLIWFLMLQAALESNLINLKWIRTSGERCASRMLPIRLSLWPRVFALLRDSMVFLILRLWRMGTSDMNSTPPATTASHWPAAIRPTAGEKEGGERDKRSNKVGGDQKNWLGILKKVNFYKCTSLFFFPFSILNVCAIL